MSRRLVCPSSPGSLPALTGFPPSAPYNHTRSGRFAPFDVIIIIIIITKAKIIVTLSRKNFAGSLYSHRNVTQTRRNTASERSRCWWVSKRAKVTQSSSGEEPSSAPCEKTQVTSRPWPTQAVRSTLLMQPLGMSDRQVLNVSTLAWTFRFAPETFRPQNVLFPGHFSPKTFRSPDVSAKMTSFLASICRRLRHRSCFVFSVIFTVCLFLPSSAIFTVWNVQAKAETSTGRSVRNYNDTHMATTWLCNDQDVGLMIKRWAKR